MRHRAKRNQAFENSPFIGLAINATGAGRCQQSGCELCRPRRNAHKEVIGYLHRAPVISAVGAGLTLPFDAEPYGPGDSEYAAGQRLLKRAAPVLGPRFADYPVVDSELATAPFLHAAGRAGLHAVARRKANLPEPRRQVETRFGQRKPTRVYRDGRDRVEMGLHPVRTAEDLCRLPWLSLSRPLPLQVVPELLSPAGRRLPALPSSLP